jgi:ATP-dependent Clp protease, protease subunit
MRTIVEERTKNMVIMDVFSKLIQERIIFIDEPVTDELASGVISQMLYLDSLDTTRPINIYINTPGGLVTSGMAIYDTSQLIKSPIRTVGLGLIASMGIILFLMGAERCCTKNAEFMIHQPSGYAEGQASDMQIAAEQIIKWRAKLSRIISEKTGKTFEEVDRDSNRDYWMDAEEAKAYGIVHSIL